MRYRVFAVAFALFVALAHPASAQNKNEAGYPLTPLLSATTSILGEPLQYPTTGPAHVTAAIVALAPGARTIMHRHGVPLFAYILEGELTVDYGARGKRTYRKGDTFMEAMGVDHFGANTGTEPVRLLAVYIGAQGSQDTIVDK